MYKVLVTDYVWPTLDPERRVLEEIGGELIVAPNGDEATLAELAREADGILTCFAKVTPKVIDAAPKLKVIGRYGIGVDNIAVDHATQKNIVVTNVPEYCLDEVSDHAMALLLACIRKIPVYNQAVKQRVWDTKVGMPMYRIRGRTLGLAGYGKIGRLVMSKAQAFGMNVIVYDPYVPAEAVAERGGRKVDFDTLLRESDYISIHAPLTPETHHLFNEAAFRKMKPTAVIVNTSRGPLIDTAALARALREGIIAFAGLDVLPSEPPAQDDPLLDLPNVILTPHVAFYSEESLVELQTKATQEVARVLTGRMPLNVVNKAVLEHVKLEPER